MSFAVNLYHPDLAGSAAFQSELERIRAVPSTPRAPFESRVRSLDLLARQLLNASSPVRQQVPADGLAYLATFLRADFIENLVRREIGSRSSLTEFARVEPRKSVRHVPRGIVCHWVAGNVPLLAMFSWAISAVVGNRNVMRLSSRQIDVVSPFLRQLADLSETGEEIARETIVVSFDTSNTSAHQMMSDIADVRIAWGGQEAVNAVRGLPAAWHCEDIVFGPRASMAVVDPANADESLIRRLAIDVAVFDQLACSSPQNIFVKANPGPGAIDAFAESLSRALASASRSYPRHPLDFGETYRIGLDRARVLMEGGHIYRDAGTQWTIAVVDRPNDQIRCANRFVQIVPFQDVSEIYSMIPLNVQTVVVQLTGADFAEFTETAATLGVCRFPQAGEGNNFENPWDGVGLVSRLTRMVIRTDPSSYHETKPGTQGT